MTIEEALKQMIIDELKTKIPHAQAYVSRPSHVVSFLLDQHLTIKGIFR